MVVERGYPPEVKAMVLAGAALGQSVREIRGTLAGHLKEETPGTGTIHRWISASENSAQWAQARFAAQAALHLSIMDSAGSAIQERLDKPEELTPSELNFLYGTSTDKALQLAKLSRESRRDNILQDALRAALDLPAAERRRVLIEAGMPGSEAWLPGED